MMQGLGPVPQGMVFTFTARFNSGSNRFGGGEGVGIAILNLDMLYLFGFRHKVESGSEEKAWGWSRDLNNGLNVHSYTWDPGQAANSLYFHTLKCKMT